MIARWFLYFIPALIVEIFCWLTAPIACLFVRKESRQDRVKRLGNETLAFDREYLRAPFDLWATHDNAVDEYFWGLFTDESVLPFIRNATMEQYRKSRFVRYVCRLLWVWRNTAYGFHYKYFSVPYEDATDIITHGEEGNGFWYELRKRPNSWQIRAHVPIGPIYNSMNIGFKSHRGFPRMMIANRLVGIRTYKKENKNA